MKNKQSPLLFLILIFLQLPACKKDDPAPDSPPPKPVAAYDFTGNMKNSVSQLHDGMAVGDMELAADSFNTPNSAYLFSGNAYILIPDSDILDFPGNQFTIAAWILPDSTSVAYVVHKSVKLAGGGAYSLDIFPGHVRALVHTTTDETFLVEGKSKILKAVWQHIAVTFSGEQLTVYYNGENEGSIAVDRPLQTTTGNMEIGAYAWGFPAGSFTGIIDQVRMYDKALTDAQVRDLYKNYK